MTVEHGSFTIEKTIAASPASVFRAYADADHKLDWFVPPGTGREAYSLDFRIGGRETGRFDIADGPGKGLHENATTFLDIIENARIVYAHKMSWDGRIHSASLATVTLAPTEAGCRLTITEQGAFFAPSDGPEMRQGGIAAQIDALAATFV